jgi:hypothetical protein
MATMGISEYGLLFEPVLLAISIATSTFKTLRYSIVNNGTTNLILFRNSLK